MAFCSGSSFSTDRWTRRKGLPSSDQLLKVGNASLLHQYSSSKPTAQSGSASAPLISRSRRLFSFVQGIGRADPAFGSLPTHPHPLKGGPDALSRNSLFGKPLLEAHLCGHLERPEATVASELPRRAVEQFPQGFGSLLVEDGAGPPGTRRFGCKSIQASLVEGVDGVAHRLLTAAQVLGYLRDLISP